MPETLAAHTPLVIYYTSCHTPRADLWQQTAAVADGAATTTATQHGEQACQLAQQVRQNFTEIYCTVTRLFTHFYYNTLNSMFT